jgi:2-polyprenyl-3-methyl-5-hydroxy-6-metoxy-1,4-benzoquinol methylase
MSYLRHTLVRSASEFRDASEAYWGDKRFEASKPFNVGKFGFYRIDHEPKYVALLNQLTQVVAETRIDVAGARILSVASGSCWLEAKWLRANEFKKLACIDVSAHRIHELAPATMAHYGLSGDISLFSGSIFDFEIDGTEKFDIVLLAQAFHHIEEPIRLLRFLSKLLSPSGVVVLVGEHHFRKSTYFWRAWKHFVKYAINWKSYRALHHLFPGWQDLFPPDYEKGDIHWSLSEYDFLFRKSGFSNYRRAVDPTQRFQSFVLKKGNHEKTAKH